jgi:hypothetical protein
MDISTLSYEELKTYALDQGIEFPGNISKTKLIELLEKPAQEEKVLETPVPVSPTNKGKAKKLTPEQRARQLVKVIVNNLDPTENGKITTVPVTAINPHFSVTALVPFGVTVELPRCVIQALREIKMITYTQDDAGMFDPVSGTKVKTKFAANVPKYQIQYVA